MLLLASDLLNFPSPKAAQVRVDHCIGAVHQWHCATFAGWSLVKIWETDQRSGTCAIFFKTRACPRACSGQLTLFDGAASPSFSYAETVRFTCLLALHCRSLVLKGSPAPCADDWQHCPTGLEGVAHGSDRLRTEWREKTLSPLFGRRNMSHWHEDIGGLRFVAVDNSTGFITPEQLTFFRQAVVEPALKVVLLMHIPIQLPGLMQDGRSDGGASTIPE